MTERMGQPLRVTENTVRVLRVLAASDAPLWGVTITQRAGLAYNTGRPVIVRLESHGWVERTIEPKGACRTCNRKAAVPRHLFALTPDGRLQAEALLKDYPAPEESA